MVSKEQSLSIRKANRTVFTKLTFLFAAAIRLSNILYILSLNRHAWTYDLGRLDTTLIPRVLEVNRLVYDAATFAVMLGLVIWALGRKPKKAWRVNTGLGIVLAIFLLDLYGSARQVIRYGVQYSEMIDNYIMLPSFLFALLPVIPVLVCLLVNVCKVNGKPLAVHTDRYGLGGFMILPVFRYLVMPFVLAYTVFTTLNRYGVVLIRNALFLDTVGLSHAMLFAVYGMLLWLYTAAMVKLFQKDAKFVPYSITAESIWIFTVLYRVAAAFSQNDMEGLDYFTASVYLDGWGVLFSAMLIVYLSTSGRVRNTFLLHRGPRKAGKDAVGAVGAPVPPAAMTGTEQTDESDSVSGVFYVFAVQGPAFGKAASDLMIREKAGALQGLYEGGGRMKLQIIRPDRWNWRLKTSGGKGFTQVSFALPDFTDGIREYLKTRKVSKILVEEGIAQSEQYKLQLSNPVSGLYLIGIPVAVAAAQDMPAPQPESTGTADAANAEQPVEKQHEIHEYSSDWAVRELMQLLPNYLDNTNQARTDIRNIGIRADRNGGMFEMRKVASAVQRANPLFASYLNNAWDEIGDWMG